MAFACEDAAFTSAERYHVTWTGEVVGTDMRGRECAYG